MTSLHPNGFAQLLSSPLLVISVLLGLLMNTSLAAQGVTGAGSEEDPCPPFTGPVDPRGAALLQEERFPNPSDKGRIDPNYEDRRLKPIEINDTFNEANPANGAWIVGAGGEPGADKSRGPKPRSPRGKGRKVASISGDDETSTQTCSCGEGFHFTPSAPQTSAPPPGMTDHADHNFNHVGSSQGVHFYNSDTGPGALERHPGGGTPYMIQHLPDGTSIRYDRYNVSPVYGDQFRPVWIRDAFDNLWTYQYSTGSPSRLEKLTYPSGLEEHWDFDPAWAQVAGYSGVEITYTNVAQAGSIGAGAVTASDLTWGMLFKHSGSWTEPFNGAELFRIFHPKTPYLPTLADENSLYALTPSSEHFVEEFEYASHGGRRRISKQFYGRSASMTTAPLALKANAIWEYGVQNGRTVVNKFIDRFGDATTYSFTVDSTNSFHEYMTVTDAYATVTEYKFDERYRIVRKTVTPSADYNGLPRQFDPENTALGANAIAEPTTQVWTHEYGAASCTCGGPTKVTSPTGREVEYTWEPLSGRMLSRTETNPSNITGAPSTVSTEWEWTWNPAQGRLDGTPVLLAKETVKEGSSVKLEWTHTHTWENKPVGPGQRVTQSVVTSSPISLADSSTETLTATVNFNGDGTIGSEVDFDGVQTDYDYWPNRMVKRVAVGANSSETVTTEFDFDGWGRLLESRTNVGTTEELSTKFESTVDGEVTRVTRLVDGVEHETLMYYDEWGNQAVVRVRNLDSAGNPPMAHGSTTAGRPYIHRESHYDGNRLLRRYVDRRSLGDTASGVAYDDETAWLLRTDFLYRPDGVLSSILEPNGSESVLTFDGYGELYKVEVSGAVGATTETVLRAKIFVNGELEPVNLFRGDANAPLWIKLTRGSVGQMLEVEHPGLAGGASPPGYIGTPNGYVAKFNVDYLGNVIEEKRHEVGLVPILAHAKYEFDELGRLHTVQNYGYKGTQQLSGVSRDVKTQFAGASKVVRRDFPGNRYVTFAHDSLARVTTVSDNHAPGLNTFTREFLPKSSFLKETRRSVWEDVLTGSDALRVFTTQYGWDKLGRLKTLTKSGSGAGLSDAFTYYTSGFTESHTDPEGKTQRFLPDALGRLVEHVRYGQAGSVIHNTATFSDFRTDGRTLVELRQELAEPRVTRTYFDFAGRRSILMHPGAATEPTTQNPHVPLAWLFEYDSASRLSDIYDGEGIHTELFYNGMGQLIGRDIPGGLTGSSADLFGPTRELLVRDALGLVTSAWTLNVGGSGTLVFNSETFEPDTLGRTHREEYGFGIFGAPTTHAVTSNYDLDVDFRSKLTYTSGLELEFVPDSIGRVDEIRMKADAQSPQNWLAKYGYVGGRMRHRTTRYSNGVEGKTEQEFDDYFRPTKLSHYASTATPALPIFEYEYDDASNLIKEKYSKASGVGVGDRFVYDDFDRLTEGWLGLDFNSIDQPLSGSTVFVQKLTYGMDQAGNRTQVDDELYGQTPVPESYSTEDATHPAGPSNRYDSVGGQDHHYDYRGNLHLVEPYYYKYDFRNRLTEVWEIVPAGGSEEASSGGGASSPQGQQQSQDPAPEFSAADNLAAIEAARLVATASVSCKATLSRNCRTATVSAPIMIASAPESGQQQLSSSGGGGGTAESGFTLNLVAAYIYDPFNRRVTKAVIGEDTAFFTYDGWRETEELRLESTPTLTNVVEKQFVWGRRLNELVSYLRRDGSGGWDEYFIHGGGQDSVFRVVDGTGNVVEGTDYDPYGKPTVFDLSNGPPVAAPNNRSTIGLDYGWKGHRVDAETGFTYMRNRYYSSALGRFLTQDPIGIWGDPASSGNGYAYAGSSPQVRWDPMGLQTSTPTSQPTGPSSRPTPPTADTGSLGAPGSGTEEAGPPTESEQDSPPSSSPLDSFNPDATGRDILDQIGLGETLGDGWLRRQARRAVRRGQRRAIDECYDNHEFGSPDAVRLQAADPRAMGRRFGLPDLGVYDPPDDVRLAEGSFGGVEFSLTASDHGVSSLQDVIDARETIRRVQGEFGIESIGVRASSGPFSVSGSAGGMQVTYSFGSASVGVQTDFGSNHGVFFLGIR